MKLLGILFVTGLTDYGEKTYTLSEDRANV